MKKEISVYEFLGLINEDSSKETYINYFDRTFGVKTTVWGCLPNIFYFLDKKILFLDDIISIDDDEEDKPIIEKINIESDSPTHFYIRNEYGTKCSLTKHSKMIADKLNEVIEFLNRKEDK